MSAPRPVACMTIEDGHVHVSAHWLAEPPLDRPDTGGWSVGRDSEQTRKLAARLLDAIDAGAVYTDPQIVRDVNGASYVRASSMRVLGRTLNADLRRLGY